MLNIRYIKGNWGALKHILLFILRRCEIHQRILRCFSELKNMNIIDLCVLMYRSVVVWTMKFKFIF